MIRLRERGVLLVAASYAVIAWLVLQIADVTFEPMGAPAWAMRALITLALVGLPSHCARVMPQILQLRGRSAVAAPEDTLRLDALLEWTARPLAPGGRDYRYHTARSEALTGKVLL